MKRYQYNFYIFLFIWLISSLFACSESNPEADDIIKDLEVEAGINTFSLTIILSDKLNGETFPADIQHLCSLSKWKCKTLTVAGLLRLGPNKYYPYNCISELDLSGSFQKSEAMLTQMVDRQVTAYLSTTKLTDYHSLLLPNDSTWNIKALSQTYIDNTTDSVFFFSNSSTPSVIQSGSRMYPVYTDIKGLRKEIDELICKGYETVSVFYDHSSLNSSGSTITTTNPTLKGKHAGDTCIRYSKYEKLHDGMGGFIRGNLIDSNSADCGYVFAARLAGDTCVNGSKYQKVHNGKGGFKIGRLLERNSRGCGFTFPARGTSAAGFICYKGSKFAKIHNGKGSFIRGRLIEANSSACGSGGTDIRCFTKSEPKCEKDSKGNYTGRKVQSCYNKSGRMIRTIVLAKCDLDCRCFEN